MPQITRPVVIDGTTQPGYAGKPIIDIDGTSAGSSTIGFAVEGSASGTAAAPAALKGLEITDFGGGGVSIQADYFNLNTDYIGLAWNATVSYVREGNGGFGVQLSGGATDDSVIGSTVAATKGNGVVIAGSGTSSNTLTGDFIGTDPTGESAEQSTASRWATPASASRSDAGATHNTISDLGHLEQRAAGRLHLRRRHGVTTRSRATSSARMWPATTPCPTARTAC